MNRSFFLICSLSFAFLFLLMFLNCNHKYLTSYQAVVNQQYSGTSGEKIDGIQTFLSVGEALAAIPKNNESRFAIFIHKGMYVEKLSIDQPNVELYGEDRDKTIISYNATGSTKDSSGKPYGTWGCYTLRVTAPDFHAENLTIENSFDYPANAAKSDEDSSKIQNLQAVALMTDLNSDRAVLRNCKISGYQDTYFGNAGRQYLDDCEIMGHVDFIFGAGQAVFKDCKIVSRNRVDKNPTGYITAPSTPMIYPYGFLFIDCHFLKESAELPKASVRLGRPWHPGGDLSVSGSAVFIHCFMDDHLGPEGYARISSRNAAGERIWFDLEPDSRFFEYENYGSGAINSPNRPKLTETSAAWYTAAHVLNGWIPQ